MTNNKGKETDERRRRADQQEEIVRPSVNDNVRISPGHSLSNMKQKDTRQSRTAGLDVSEAEVRQTLPPEYVLNINDDDSSGKFSQVSKRNERYANNYFLLVSESSRDEELTILLRPLNLMHYNIVYCAISVDMIQSRR